MKPFEPMLSASLDDVLIEDLYYPLIASPKLDGIRCIMKDGKAYTRNMKLVRNEFIQAMLAGLDGLDGELIVGSPTDPYCMNNTQSGVMSKDGMPNFRYHVFDEIAFLVPTSLAFDIRFNCLRTRKDVIEHHHVVVVPHTVISTPYELLGYEKMVLEAGYEGVMLRNPDGPYKFGRSTLKQGYLMKLKRFIDGEGTVIELEEAQENLNEATEDAFGRTKRSHHQGNKVGKGMVGVILIKTDDGSIMRLQPGVMKHPDRVKYYEAPATILGKRVHWRAFGYGQKDTPRFPRFYGFREDNV